MPQVSVIIPCFNAAAWIERVLESCMEQGPTLGEVIVVEDGSTDGSAEIVESVAARSGGVIRLISNPGKGGNAARNFGFENSRFDFIQWLDADDFLLPGKFDAQLSTLEAQPDLDIVWSDWEERFHDADGNRQASRNHDMATGEDLLLMLAADKWSVPANYLMRRSLAARVVAADGWNPARRVAQDREFFTLAALFARKASHVPGTFAVYNRQESGTVSGMDFGERLELQMDLEARLRRDMEAHVNDPRTLRALMRRLNSHTINAYFYNRRIRPRDCFWPWVIAPELIHWKKLAIYPALYLGAMLNCLRGHRLAGTGRTK